MRLKRLAALVLAGVLCLTSFVGCGANANDTIATMGTEKVSFGVANFIVKYQKASVDDMYAMYSTYYGVESLWDIDMYGSGNTTEEDFKDSAMDLIHEMYSLKAHMADYGIEITDEDKAAIQDAASAFMAANTEEALEEFGATEEIVEEVLTLYTIQARVYQAIIAGADHNVSDEEANMRGYSMIVVDLTGTTDDQGNAVEYTDDEIAALKEDAVKMALELKSQSMEDVAKEHNYKVEASAYAKEDDSLEPEVLKALDGLKEGEVSDVVETEDAIYLLRIDADTDKDATEAHREEIISERENELFNETLKKFQENDGWKVNESMLKKIEFHHVFTLYKDTESEAGTEEGTELTTEVTDVKVTVDGTESN